MKRFYAGEGVWVEVHFRGSGLLRREAYVRVQGFRFPPPQRYVWFSSEKGLLAPDAAEVLERRARAEGEGRPWLPLGTSARVSWIATTAVSALVALGMTLTQDPMLVVVTTAWFLFTLCGPPFLYGAYRAGRALGQKTRDTTLAFIERGRVVDELRSSSTEPGPEPGPEPGRLTIAEHTDQKGALSHEQ